MKKKLLLFLSLASLSLVACNGKDKKDSSNDEISSIVESSSVESKEEQSSVEASSEAQSSVVESSVEASSEEESSTSQEKTPKEGQQIVTRDEYIEAVKDIEKRPQELGYKIALIEYDMDLNGTKSSGTWTFIYDDDKGKWLSDDGKADDYNYLLNYTITSRIGNPEAELTFYTNPYAVSELSRSSGNTTYFEWNNEGLIVEFKPEGWVQYGTSTFEFTYSKGIKE